jgi:hypothetical protein
MSDVDGYLFAAESRTDLNAGFPGLNVRFVGKIANEKARRENETISGNR